MDHLLNLSTAAKLVGVSRGTIQSNIKNGELETFEGHVRMSSLCEIYPAIEDKTDPVLERVNRLRDNAVWDASHVGQSGERALSGQVHQLQVELQEVYAKVDAYKALLNDLYKRLAEMKEGCDRDDKQKLQALLHWMSTRL